MARPMARRAEKNGRVRMEVWLPTGLKDRLARAAFESGKPPAGIIAEALAARLPPSPGASQAERAALWLEASVAAAEAFPSTKGFGVAEETLAAMDTSAGKAWARESPEAHAAAVERLVALLDSVVTAVASLRGEDPASATGRVRAALVAAGAADSDGAEPVPAAAETPAKPNA